MAEVTNYMSINQEPVARASNYYGAQGCHVAPYCLTCPLSVCIEEVPGGPYGFAYRNLQIQTLADHDEMSMDEIGEVFGVSKRTVLKALRPEARAILSWRVIDDREEL